METLTALAKLLGEENEKRLRDELTDMLIEQLRTDLNEYTDWIIPLEDIISELNDEIYLRVKDVFLEKYSEMITNKLSKTLYDLFSKQEGQL